MRTHLIQLLVELVKLRSLRHLVLVHEERGLDLFVPAAAEEIEAIRDKGLVEIDAVAGEVVPAMACDFGTAVKVHGIEAEENFVMWQDAFSWCGLRELALGIPCSDYGVIVLFSLSKLQFKMRMS